MIEFSKKSWHYRMAKLISSEWSLEYRANNICSYGRRVLAGTICFAAISATLSFFVVFNVFGIALAVFHGADAWSDSMFGALNFLSLIVIAVFAVPAVWHHYDVEWKIRKFFRNVGSMLTPNKKTENTPRPRKEPSLLATWYRSVKDKFCAPIRFVGG